MIKDIIVKDRVGVQKFTSDSPYVIISITDTAKNFPVLKNVNNLKDVLRLRFTDDDRDINQNKDGMKYDCKLFTVDQARKIWHFVNDADFDLIVCQCDGGISRSSAVAAALWKVFTNDDSIIFRDKRYVPNMLVYRTMLDTFDKEFIRDDKVKKEKKEKKEKEKKSLFGGYFLSGIFALGAFLTSSYILMGLSIYVLFNTIVLPDFKSGK